nr:hypothetical protein [Tanacetum cinerariifolium]
AARGHRGGCNCGFSGRNGGGLPGYLPLSQRTTGELSARVSVLGARQYASPKPSGPRA